MIRQPRWISPLTALALATLSACSNDAPTRRQVLIFIDTDAPTLEQALNDETLSGEAAVDMIRVDILDEQDATRVFLEVSATSPLDWPISFALVPPDVGASTSVRLRVRAFRARDATSALEDGVPTLSPPATLALDRVVEITMPAEGIVDRRLLHLSSACLGRPSSFRDRTSCIDAAHTSAPFTTELPRAAEPLVSQIGTAALARAVPCASASSDDRVCIPGGLSILGTSLTAGVEDGLVTLSALPMRPVRVAPFFMDKTEFTVGRARRWLPQLTHKPYERGTSELDRSQYCTLSDDPSADALPLNCVLEETAAELCALEGGALPTEAEWNHAATGRGEGRLFPWGDNMAECCGVSAGRLAHGQNNDVHICQGEGIEPVGSHLGASCESRQGDVSRDGVFDLGGSLSEILRDRPQRLDDPCWGELLGVLVDPVCTKQTGITSVATRGSNWSNDLIYAMGTFRSSRTVGPTRGFRCVYRDGAR